MGKLLDLITSLGPAPDAAAIAAQSCAEASKPSAHDHQQRAREPSPIQAPEATSEPKRTAWRITRAGRPVGYMVGQLMTYSEALACAVMRWPDAEILETR